MIAEKRHYTVLSSSNDYCEVGHDAELQALVLTYRRSGTSEEYRAVYHTLLEVIKRVAVSRLLINTVELGAIPPDDQRWLGQTMLPMLAMALPGQHLYMAVLVPDNIFTQLAVEHIEQLSEAYGTCTNKHFTSLVAAKMWLREQPSL